MFDGLPARIEAYEIPWSIFEDAARIVSCGHGWLSLPGGPVAYRSGAWRRVPEPLAQAA
jgi:hypothetical protein